MFATGPNSQGGGKRTTRGHYDVPMRGCTIELDGKTIIAKGRVRGSEDDRPEGRAIAFRS